MQQLLRVPRHPPDGLHARRRRPTSIASRRSPRSSCARARSSSIRCSPPTTSRCWPPPWRWSCGPTCSRRWCRCSPTRSCTIPSPGFDKNGDPVLFYRAGRVSIGNDPEFEVASEARVVYKSGELPVMLKRLGADGRTAWASRSPTCRTSTRTGRRWCGMLGILAILLPLTRAAAGPLRLDGAPAADLLVQPAQGAGAQASTPGQPGIDPEALQAELERIDSHVRSIRVPLYFSDQLYDLRGHVDLVRQRLAPEAARPDGGANSALPNSDSERWQQRCSKRSSLHE